MIGCFACYEVADRLVELSEVPVVGVTLDEEVGDVDAVSSERLCVFCDLALGHTSMEVGVRVEAENPRTGERRHTSTAYLTMVALDDHAKPTRVPELLTETDAEARRRREAELRRANRLAERDQIVDARDEAAPG